MESFTLLQHMQKNKISASSADLTSIKSRSEFCDNKANVDIFQFLKEQENKQNEQWHIKSYFLIQRYQSLNVTYSFKGGCEKTQYMQNQVSFRNS